MQPNPPTNTMTTTHPTPLSSSPAPAWTPGPWKAQHEFDFDPTYIMAANGLIVAASCCDDDAPQDPQEVLANARLIAAAPEMAEALQMLVLVLADLAKHPAFEDDAPEFNDGGDAREAMKQARAILARINGNT